MWTGPIHNKEFVEQMLAHIEDHGSDFKTADRIKGMVTVAKNVSFRARVTDTRAPGTDRALLIISQELEEPLYFTPTRIAGNFNCTSPPLNLVA